MYLWSDSELYVVRYEPFSPFFLVFPSDNTYKINQDFCQV